jgi:CheY-like chemotaxis protein
VLIVDDIQTNLTVAKGLLLPYKMDIDLCISGKEAIAAVQVKQYDIVFMDHRMPEMDGVVTTDHIRALGGESPYFKHLPIIALTANAVIGMRDIFLQSGFDDFLSKPIDIAQLNTILEKWIPKEKQVGQGGDRVISTESSCQEAIKIEGLDTARGILQTGGTFELYLDTLTVFCEDAQMQKDRIMNSLDSCDLGLFTTYIHALKSAAANIGAIELSNDAYILEEAGQNADLAFIKANIDQFLKELDKSIQNISTALSSCLDMDGESAEDFDVVAFTSELVVLIKALTDLDAGVMNRTIRSLLNFSCEESDKVILRNISSSLLMGEYDEAIVLAESLLSKYPK